MNPSEQTEAPELSVVLPCLNEADTLATCLRKAKRALVEHGINGELVVADNGSRDASREIAREEGARVVDVGLPGYGNALMGGIEAARGRFIIMGDADDSYDFLEIPKFIRMLREGYDLVQGCRLPAGGGTVAPGAMPLTHRWLGNPLFSILVRRWFSAPIHDVYCGMRGFRQDFYGSLNLRCTGMEFATEMIIKASLLKAKITEVPITLHRDGRKSHAPHLKTFRDGWRTLRFFLMCSPRWLFLWPGLAIFLIGLSGYGIALPGLVLGGVHFDVHTLLVASLSILCGFQSMLFAIFARTFAVTTGILPPNRNLERFYQVINLERGLAGAGLCLLVGIYLILAATNEWRHAHFGDLEYSVTMRILIPGVTLLALGFQTILSSFLISMMGMKRR